MTSSPKFIRSSFCNGNGCVEVAVTTTGVWLRDGKETDTQPHRFSIEEWAAFIAGVKAGEFDLLDANSSL